MYTKLPNKFVERLPDLSGTEVKIMLVIYRQTIGYHQRETTLSLSHIAKLTGSSIRQISTALARLQAEGFILSKATTAQGTVYAIHDAPDGCCNDAPIEEIAIEKTAIAKTAIAKTATKVLQKLPTYKERKENTISNDIVHSEKPAKPKRQRKPKEPQPTTPTALTIFREYHRLQVPIALRENVLATVSDLDKWEGVCKEWIARGYRKGNVAGCLQVYQEGWKDVRSKRNTQRGDIQRQQREERMESYIAEYEREITAAGTGNHSRRDDRQRGVRGQQGVLEGVLPQSSKTESEDGLPF